MAFDDIPVELAAEVFKNLDYGVDSNSIARPSSVTLGTIERGLVHDCPVEVASPRPCLPVTLFTTDEGRHFPPVEFQRRGLPHAHLILTIPPPLPPSGAIAQLYVALSRCTTKLTCVGVEAYDSRTVWR